MRRCWRMGNPASYFGARGSKYAKVATTKAPAEISVETMVAIAASTAATPANLRKALPKKRPHVLRRINIFALYQRCATTWLQPRSSPRALLRQSDPSRFRPPHGTRA